jgi:hypothetical protein
MENKRGENHCFLNVIIQSFWHLASFRRNFLNQSKDHRHNNSEFNVFAPETRPPSPKSSKKKKNIEQEIPENILQAQAEEYA